MSFRMTQESPQEQTNVELLRGPISPMPLKGAASSSIVAKADCAPAVSLVAIATGHDVMRSNDHVESKEEEDFSAKQAEAERPVKSFLTFPYEMGDGRSSTLELYSSLITTPLDVLDELAQVVVELTRLLRDLQEPSEGIMVGGTPPAFAGTNGQRQALQEAGLDESAGS